VPDTLFATSMLLPSVQALLSWWTFFASGLLEWNAATFAIVTSPLPCEARGGSEGNDGSAPVIPRGAYAASRMRGSR
jgi:hypothetical protein